MIKKLHIDIETYSSVDIGKSGSYKYAQADDFEILLFAYSADGAPVEVVDLKNGEEIPDAIIRALSDNHCMKYAYNAAFEWWCLNQAGYATPLHQWECDMVHGLYCGYPAGLGRIGEAIGLDQDKKKMTAGKALIRYFCIPCKPTKSNGQRERNLPKHDMDKWELFKEYCRQDVVTEMAIAEKLENFPVPEREWTLWRFDISMAAFGVAVDEKLVQGALDIDMRQRDALMKESQELTGLENPNSGPQLLKWLLSQGVTPPNLTKATVAELLKTELPDKVRRVLELRQELAKTSVKKYQAMENAAGKDGRIRGLMQFYGANRTGRYAGRLVQVQNLPRNYIESLDTARELIREGDIEMIDILYGNVPDTLSQLIRTAFVPSEGNHFVVSDFSAIEARVIAWLAGETWRLEVFETHGKIYEASASQMFGVPLETIVKGHENYALRAKGKVAELALGYQGGVGALEAMGGAKMGLSKEEMAEIVTKWRKSSPNIAGLWKELEKASVKVLETGQAQMVHGKVILRREADLEHGQDFLTVELPTGRKLYYPKPILQDSRFGVPQMHFYGSNQTTGKWEVIPTYGGKLTENIVQAIARDCLTETLLKIQEAGWPCVFHVHDEVILDVPETVELETVTDMMGEEIPWAKGLCLKAAGFTGHYYMKD